jgi:hypothetical protein
MLRDKNVERDQGVAWLVQTLPFRCFDAGTVSILLIMSRKWLVYTTCIGYLTKLPFSAMLSNP